MAKQEVEEGELTMLKRGAALLEQLNGDPKARRFLEQAVKVKFPDVVTQDDQIAEIAKPYIEQIDALKKTIDDRFAAEDKAKKDAAELAAEANLNAAFERLRGQGYTDEGLGKIAAIMVERKVADPEAAAALFDRLNPKPAEPAPSTWEPNRWNLSDDAVVDTKALFENPDKWADSEVGKVLTEVRNARAA